jgi:tripartite-type tricarboxylate transporter receptor subunit TctC
MFRRTLITLGLAAVGLNLSGLVHAQDSYPARPVVVIVPQAPGGANDAIARVITQKLSELLGRQFVIENRAGAGGNIGTAAAAEARPDGYTLLLTTNSAQVINPWLYKSTGFDPVRDFEAVATVATAGYVLVANPAFPAGTVRELIAIAKAKPGSIMIASAGNGTLNHLIGEMLQKAAGIELVHVPYKAAAAAATDTASGQVSLSVQSVPSSLGLIQSGRLKVLGVVNEKRLASFPKAPTIGETIAGFGSTPWYGIFAPAGTPKAIVDRLQATVQTALDAKDVQDKLAAQGCVMKGTSAQFAALVREDLPKWQKIVRESGATLD